MIPALLLANNPPAPQMMLSEVLLLPLMIAFTALAGGYPILKAQTAKWWRRTKPALAVLAIFVSAAHEGFGFLVTVAFALIAIARGVRLIRWGKTGWGAALCAVALLLGGTAPVFIGFGYGSGEAEFALRQAVAYELAALKKNGAFDAPSGDSPISLGTWKSDLRTSGRWATDFEMAPDRRSFKVWVTPRRFPIFPYNLLASQPSFYADQSGQLRRIRVHSPARCPPDAPVFRTIEELDLDRAALLLERGGAR